MKHAGILVNKTDQQLRRSNQSAAQRAGLLRAIGSTRIAFSRLRQKGFSFTRLLCPAPLVSIGRALVSIGRALALSGGVKQGAAVAFGGRRRGWAMAAAFCRFGWIGASD